MHVQVDGGSCNAASGTTAWQFNLDTTALSNGAHTITARVTDAAASTATATINVTVYTPVVTSLTLTPTNASIHVGQTRQFTTVTLDQHGAAISNVSLLYNTTASSVAVINTSGLAAVTVSSGVVVSNSAVVTVTDNVTSSVNDIHISNNPIRPSRGITTNTFSNLPPNAKLRILTLSGRLVKELTADSSGIVTWDVGSTPSGIYFLSAQGNGTSRTFKIALQR